MKRIAILLVLTLTGCAEQQSGGASGAPASLQLVPPGYYSAKPRYTNTPRRVAPARSAERDTPSVPDKPQPKIRSTGRDSPAMPPHDLEELEARADAISQQLRDIRQQLNVR